MSHITGIKTAADVELQYIEDYGGAVSPESDPQLISKVQSYKHFNLQDEQLGRTRRYNCWGFTFLPRRYWINSSSDVDQILADNCIPVSPGSLRPGDVIRYRDSNNVTTHTGRVWEVDAGGNCTKVRSKWGGMAEYIHIPLEPYITPLYGTNLAYFRQVSPLKGIGDLWIRDASNDLGEQYSFSLWASPDIIVDAPPHGSVDANPVFGSVNRVWAMVHNRSNAEISDAHVRYYWANPNVGFAPSNWQLIPATSGHPNPTSPFTVPPNATVQAPFVEWIPEPLPGVADPAHQCLLAVAFVNDDPKDSANPSPLVYPFDIRWENGIAARNVHVVYLHIGQKVKLELALTLPFDEVRQLTTDLHIRLASIPASPVLGFPPDVIPPRVHVSLNGKRSVDVVPLKRGSTPGRGRDPLLKKNGATTFLPAVVERTIASRRIKQVLLLAKKPVRLQMEIEAGEQVQVGTSFHLRFEQEIQGFVTSCYTVVIHIVKS
jgi:hypothetical protein